MKSEKKEFVVMGLGRFGGSMCKELVNEGVNVMAIDKDQERVQKYEDVASHVATLDAMDKESLKSVGISNFDVAIISFGGDLESSILVTMLLKEMNVKQIWVKARNEYHQKILEKIGADKIIHPERDMARRIAHHITSDKIVDYIELSNKHSIIEVVASDKIIGKTIANLKVQQKFKCKVIAIKKDEETVSMIPSDDVEIERGDILIVMGDNKKLNRLEVEL
ncbi:potassium transporter Trk [Paraliobacillus quinghaiensis]|uniref:Potassium transporter Trk n=1 Tax=Paraliobacillus quinghaiensis TaxID=470815 RepID=A0A917WU85_9BACI|nr:TrkA family potassium uptake protein [Paraliobacillus quinghaiensis]GGM28353.1 potassium transporter Trk [Paraliobacillus quinghaiensis]